MSWSVAKLPAEMTKATALVRKDPLNPGVLAPRSVQNFFTDELADLIVDQYVGGASLTKIGASAGMPHYGTILRWMHTNDRFREKMRAAAEVRALHFFEQALQAGAPVNEDGQIIPYGKDEVPAARLAHEALKWAAEVHDPGRYGKKVAVAGDSLNPFQIIVSTGIPAPKDAVQLNEQGLLESPPESTEPPNG